MNVPSECPEVDAEEIKVTNPPPQLGGLFWGSMIFAGVQQLVCTPPYIRRGGDSRHL